MATLWQDLRYAVRILAKSPGFAAVAILTLALGIGANTAIFSVVDAVLLKRLPYRDPGRLVMVWTTTPHAGDDFSPVAPADFEDWKKLNQSFESMAASTDELFTLTGAGEPQQLLGYRFSSDFLDVLGATPQLGRNFRPDEDRPGNDTVVILSHRLWMRAFAGDPSIVGRSITLDAKPYTVIGVMPAEFAHPAENVDVWAPLAPDAEFLANRRARAFRIVARLKPRVSFAAAQADMNNISHRLADLYPETDRDRHCRLETIRDDYVGDIRPALTVLLGAVGFILLIGCANLANLLLARTVSRQKEIAVRTALGASPFRLARQFLSESLVISLIGGGLGVLLAGWLNHLLLIIFPNNIANLSIPKVESLPIGGRVLLFTLLAALVTALLCGLVPAFRAVRCDVNETLKQSGRGSSTGLADRRLRSLLVVSEIALSLMLLSGAGLMLKSFLYMQRGRLGFDPNHLLAAELFLSQNRYPDPPKRDVFVNAVLDRVRALPGVRSVAVVSFIPLSGFWSDTRYAVEGQPVAPGSEPSADMLLATPDYFQTMHIPLLSGRNLSPQDMLNSQRVAVITELLARRQWPNQDPIGKRIQLVNSRNPEWAEIVGVVGDVKAFGLDKETHPTVYRPLAQISYPIVSFVVRTEGDPAQLSHVVQSQIWAVDPGQPIFKTVLFTDLANESSALRRISVILLSCFAGLALFLAILGIYGVMSYSVTQRRPEMGLRMALGAQVGDILRLVLSDGLRLALIGLAVGLAGALALSRVLSSVLFQVSATDPWVLTGVALVLVACAVAASYFPARRATRVDPNVALRYE